MKIILFVIATVTLLLTLASSGEAWEVKVKNSCNKDVTIQAMGHHLFWSQVDCEVNVGKRTTGTCQLPGAICPVRILGHYTSGDSVYDLDRVSCMGTEGVPCCWNINVEVVQIGNNSCQLQLR